MRFSLKDKIESTMEGFAHSKDILKKKFKDNEGCDIHGPEKN